MSDEHDRSNQPGPTSDSLDCDILTIDGPYDTTVRPVPLHRLPYVLAAKMQLDNPTRPLAEILAELSALSPAELEKKRAEVWGPRPETGQPREGPA
jgi:hypothetical protein